MVDTDRRLTVRTVRFLFTLPDSSTDTQLDMFDDNLDRVIEKMNVLAVQEAFKLNVNAEVEYE